MFFYTPKDNKPHIVRRQTQAHAGASSGAAAPSVNAQLAEALVRPSQEAAGPSIRQNILELARRLSRPEDGSAAEEQLLLPPPALKPFRPAQEGEVGGGGGGESKAASGPASPAGGGGSTPSSAGSSPLFEPTGPDFMSASYLDSRRASRVSRQVQLLRRPTITIQADGRVIIGELGRFRRLSETSS